MFKRFDESRLAQSITAFSAALDEGEIQGLCEVVHSKMVETIQSEYPNKFLAVLFKNHGISKMVFERSLA